MTFKEYLKYFFLLIFMPRSLRTMEWRMLKLLNKDRKDHGLKPVKMQEDLRVVARKHSKDMARKGYFEHENLMGHTPKDRFERARVTDVVAGENLAKIGGYKNATQEAEIGLMNSPGHRANILNSEYNTVGVGVVQDHEKAYLFTQNFAHRHLVFTKKIPKRATTKRGLRLKGESLTNINSILYQIKRTPQAQEILHEGTIKLKEKKFDFIIPFKEIGLFYILVFIDVSGDPGLYKTANQFEIRVRKGWI